MEVWPFHDLITRQAVAHGQDPVVVLAIAMTESAGNPWAMRYEPLYRWLYQPQQIAQRQGISADTERTAQRTSWGILQVMGAVARERGFDGQYLSTLCQAPIGLEYGLRHLDWLRDAKAYRGDDLIAAYNSGSPRRMYKGAGGYVNQKYVDRVHGFMDELRASSGEAIG